MSGVLRLRKGFRQRAKWFIHLLGLRTAKDGRCPEVFALTYVLLSKAERFDTTLYSIFYIECANLKIHFHLNKRFALFINYPLCPAKNNLLSYCPYYFNSSVYAFQPVQIFDAPHPAELRDTEVVFLPSSVAGHSELLCA